jgi:hypothetical protein
MKRRFPCQVTRTKFANFQMLKIKWFFSFRINIFNKNQKWQLVQQSLKFFFTIRKFVDKIYNPITKKLDHYLFSMCKPSHCKNWHLFFTLKLYTWCKYLSYRDYKCCQWLRQVDGFLRVFQFTPAIKLKYCRQSR